MQPISQIGLNGSNSGAVPWATWSKKTKWPFRSLCVVILRTPSKISGVDAIRWTEGLINEPPASDEFPEPKLAKIHSLVRDPNMEFSELILTLQIQASRSNFENQLEIQLRDRLTAGENHSEIQSKLSLKQNLTFAEVGQLVNNRMMSLTPQPSIPLFIDKRPSPVRPVIRMGGIRSQLPSQYQSGGPSRWIVVSCALSSVHLTKNHFVMLFMRKGRSTSGGTPKKVVQLDWMECLWEFLSRYITAFSFWKLPVYAPCRCTWQCCITRLYLMWGAYS